MAEQMEKGIISEEALEEIAGGINVDKEKLKKAAQAAGILVTGIAIGVGAKYFWDKKGGHGGGSGGVAVDDDDDWDSIVIHPIKKDDGAWREKVAFLRSQLDKEQ